MGTSINTAISPPIPLSRRVINDIGEHQRRVLNRYVEGTNRGMNTSPVQTLDEQEEEVTSTKTGQKARITPAEMQEETLQPESLETEDTSMKQVDPTPGQDSEFLQIWKKMMYQMLKMPMICRYKMTIQTHRLMLNNQIQIYLMIRHRKHHRKIIIELLLMMMSRTTQYSLVIQSSNHSCQEVSRVPITEVCCLSFTQMLQDYLHAHLPPTQVDTYSQIQGMGQWSDMYLNKYLAQYINFITSDSEFIAFVNHAIQLALDLTTYPNIWAVLLILLETQDINVSHVQMMHNYYNQCYDTRTQEHMVLLEKVAEQSKNNMYNNTLDGVSAYIQQSLCNSPVQLNDQHDANAENHTQLPHNAHFNDILTEYPAWSTDTNDTENTNQAQYRSEISMR